ncbi:MAG: TlpA family protein disulfide reductase [Nitrospirae bacterium]|nr:MAG: TlpA family protein disulfide reductase [Nitrospirota bacterium]
MKTVWSAVLVLIMLAGLLGMAGRPPLVGSPAPEIVLKDLQGQEVKLSDLRGKVVLLNFWATWCKPCKEEMPAMQASYDKLRDQGFVVLAVNELEDVDKVIEHIRTHGHTFLVVMDHDNRVANRYGVVGLPASFLIDRQGVVREHIFGNLLTEERIAELVRQYGGASASLHR